MGRTLVYVGTYTTEGEIFIYHLNVDSGNLEFIGKATNLANPSFLAVDSKQQNLYAVNEITNFAGERAGAVSAFSINYESGKISFLNSKSSKGAGPCYVSLDKTCQYIFTANYAGGSICMLPRNEDGSLGEAVDFIQHKGSSIDPTRQEGPHPHSIIVDPSNRYVFVPDLGLDKIMIYMLDLEGGKLISDEQRYINVKPGSGPRHFTFHPNGRFAYLVNELNSTIVAYNYNVDDGSLRQLQTISTLPSKFKGLNYAADIHVSPSGRFLYASNRGHDSIAIYQIDEETGILRNIGYTYTQGKWPRNFAIEPQGRFLIVANQQSNNLVSFQINEETGLLKPTGCRLQVPAPACIKILS